MKGAQTRAIVFALMLGIFIIFAIEGGVVRRPIGDAIVEWGVPRRVGSAMAQWGVLVAWGCVCMIDWCWRSVMGLRRR
jgi:hypothetical protein